MATLRRRSHQPPAAAYKKVERREDAGALHAMPRELRGARAAQATRAAGDERNLAVELKPVRSTAGMALGHSSSHVAYMADCAQLRRAARVGGGAAAWDNASSKRHAHPSEVPATHCWRVVCGAPCNADECTYWRAEPAQRRCLCIRGTSFSARPSDVQHLYGFKSSQALQHTLVGQTACGPASPRATPRCIHSGQDGGSRAPVKQLAAPSCNAPRTSPRSLPRSAIRPPSAAGTLVRLAK